MGADPRVTERCQCSRHHGGTEVRAADPDVHDIGERLALGALQAAVADAPRELRHLGPDGRDLRHHVFAVDHDRAARHIAQGRVERRPLFRRIDHAALEHRVALGFEPLGACEREESLQDSIVDPVLGIVEDEVVESYVVAAETARVGGEHVFDGGTRHLVLGGPEPREFRPVQILRHRDPRRSGP